MADDEAQGGPLEGARGRLEAEQSHHLLLWRRASAPGAGPPHTGRGLRSAQLTATRESGWRLS